MTSSVGVCCYADPLGMERLLETIKKFDYVFCVVGRWFGFEYYDSKNLEMLRIIKRYENTHILNGDGLRQHVARNLYLRKAGELGCDHLLILDSDEYLIECDYEVPKQTNAYLVKWNQTKLPRLIVNPKECYYKDRHNQIWYKNFELLGKFCGYVEGIEIIEDKSLREKGREEYQQNYNRDSIITFNQLY